MLDKSVWQKYASKYFADTENTDADLTFFSGLPVAYCKGAVLVSSPCVPFCSHLFTAVVLLALLLPLPMLLSHWLLAASAWIHSTPLSEANGHTCPGEGQICCPIILPTGQAPGCQSVLMSANPWALKYSRTLWEYAQVNLRDEQIGRPNASDCIITA